MILEDLKKDISKNIVKLHEYGFYDFTEEQLAYEYHLIFENEQSDTIDIHFEMISSTPIWTQINGIHLENLIADPKIAAIDQQLKELYQANFAQYLKRNDASYLSKNQNNYRRIGRTLNGQKVDRIFEILDEKLSVLIEMSKEISSSPAEPPLCAKTISELKRLMQEKDFEKEFNAHKKMIIATDKCEVEIVSLTELDDLLNTLIENKIDKIEWRFEDYII